MTVNTYKVFLIVALITTAACGAENFTKTNNNSNTEITTAACGTENFTKTNNNSNTDNKSLKDKTPTPENYTQNNSINVKPPQETGEKEEDRQLIYQRALEWIQNEAPKRETEDGEKILMRGDKELILDALKDPEKINIKNKWRSPLHLAAKLGNLDTVKALFWNGANIEATDTGVCPPLIVAVEEGHLEVVKFLVNKNANIEAKDDMDNTPLIWAAFNNYLEVVRFLVSEEANKEATNKYGNTALNYAEEYRREEIADLLRCK